MHGAVAHVGVPKQPVRADLALHAEVPLLQVGRLHMQRHVDVTRRPTGRSRSFPERGGERIAARESRPGSSKSARRQRARDGIAKGRVQAEL